MFFIYYFLSGSRNPHPYEIIIYCPQHRVQAPGFLFADGLLWYFYLLAVVKDTFSIIYLYIFSIHVFNYFCAQTVPIKVHTAQYFSIVFSDPTGG